MHLSHYLKAFPLTEDPERLLLFSTLRLSQATVSRQCYEAARDGKDLGSDRPHLVKLGFLVPDRQQEKEGLKEILTRANARAELFRGTVVLNLDCNLECIYCYEGAYRREQYLSAETADLLVQKLVAEQFSRGRAVNLSFYGGEPLLSLPMILRISKELQQAARHYRTRYSFDLVTNGTLLTRQAVEQMVALGLRGAKVTLDGPAEIHNAQRPFCSGAGSFDAIVANLLAVLDLIQVQIGGNFREENYREFPALLDCLLQRGVSPEKVQQVQFVPVTPQAGGGEFTSGCCCTNEPWLVEAALFLRREILRRGYRTPKPTRSACLVELEQQLVINWDGSLYKCPAFMAWPELSVGTLATGMQDYAQSHAIGHWQREECLECAYLPLCFGGCRFLSLMQGKSMAEVECRRSFLDATLEELLKQDLAVGKGTPL